MSKFKVVITDFDYDIVETEVKMLKAIGAEVVLAHCKTEDDVIEIAKDADGIICQYAPITRNVLDKLDNCKVIARYGIGFDTIDITAATEKGIVVSNVTDYCWDEVSDHAFALLISWGRKIVQQNQAIYDGVWDYKVGLPIRRIQGQTLGLVGYGHVPQTLAKKAQAFGMNIVAYDPFVSEEIAQQTNVSLVNLNTLCATSDYISVHTPLNKDTQGIIGQKQFNVMKETAFLINTARGPVVDEKALIKALQNKEIAGAGLDVLEIEPISEDNVLQKMDNVILTPHIAYYSSESEQELKEKTAQNVIDVLTGFYPTYIVNKDVKDKVKLANK